MATKHDGDEPKKSESSTGRVITQPYGTNESSKRPASANAPPSETKYDPFRSGLTEYPTDVFKKLITAQPALVPEEELYQARPPTTSSPKQAPAAPDPLPAVESPPDSIAIPIHSKRNLVVGVVALTALVLVVVLFFTTSGSDRSQAAKTTDEPRLSAASSAAAVVARPPTSPTVPAVASSPPPVHVPAQPAPPNPAPSATPSHTERAAAPRLRPHNEQSTAQGSSNAAAHREIPATTDPLLGPRPE